MIQFTGKNPYQNVSFGRAKVEVQNKDTRYLERTANVLRNNGYEVGPLEIRGEHPSVVFRKVDGINSDELKDVGSLTLKQLETRKQSLKNEAAVGKLLEEVSKKVLRGTSDITGESKLINENRKSRKSKHDQFEDNFEVALTKLNNK